MNNNQIEGHIRSAVVNMTPPLLEEILKTPIVPDTSPIPFSSARSRTRFVGVLASMAAVLALTLSVGAFYSAAAVVSVISLDVNPSVEISSNKGNKVVSATAANADGKKVLDGMKLKNVDVDVAMNSIIGSMVKNGYLSAEKNSILVTVTAKDEVKSNELRYNVVSTINETLSKSNIPAHIYNQTVSAADKADKAASAEHGISYGKLSFLEKIAAVDPDITIEQLSSMTLDEIDTLLAKHKVKPENIDLDDDEEDYCEYCGRPETVCRKSCNRTSGKRYCDDCGRLTAQCVCAKDDDGEQNNRDKNKTDNRPDHANFDTENNNRYKDKFDDDYCSYCGRLESVCLDSCNRSGGKRYCEDCGKLNAECICPDDDKDDNGKKDDDKDNNDKKDDKDDNRNNGNNGNNGKNDNSSKNDKDDDDEDSDDDDKDKKTNQGNGKVKPDKDNKPAKVGKPDKDND